MNNNQLYMRLLLLVLLFSTPFLSLQEFSLLNPFPEQIAENRTMAGLHFQNLNETGTSRKQPMEKYKSIRELGIQYDAGEKEQFMARNECQQRIGYLYVGFIAMVVLLLFFIVIWFRNKQRADAALLNTIQLNQQKSELKAALETVKLEEKDREYQILLKETQHHQMKSYLEGLEAERERLARDLHDVVSNEFVMISMKMEKDSFDKDSLRETLHLLHDKVKNISHSLMPPLFTYANFCDTIEDYVNRQKEYFTGNIGIVIQQREAWDNLPATVTLDIYRIVQEGLSNAIRHAYASDIFLRFDSCRDAFRFFIEDDGKGFDTTASTSGIGLRSMRKRVENLPGEMFLMSEAGKGTRVSVIFHTTDFPRPENTVNRFQTA